MSDNLQLGLSLNFDQNSLKELDKIMNKVRQIDNVVKQTTATLKKYDTGFAQINNVVSNAYKSFDEYGKRIKQVDVDSQKLIATYKNKAGVITQVTQSINKQDGTLKQSVKTIQTFGNTFTETIGKNISKVLEWGVSTGIVYGSIRAMSSAFKTLADSEENLVNIRKVLPDDTDFAPIMKGSQIISQKLGTSLQDTMVVAQNWARQFKNVSDIMILTNNSILGSSVTDLTLESSYKGLSSIVAQFKMQVVDTTHIIDSFNEVSNSARVRAEDLSQALSKTGSSAKLFGVGFDEMVGMIATGIETLGISGTQMGTIFSRMFARLHTDSAVKALKSINVDAFAPASKVLNDLGLKWQSLTKAQQENIAKALGGTHHYQRLMGVFQNWNRVMELTITSFDSFGSAQREAELALSTYNKKIQQLQAAFQALAVNLGNNALPTIKNIVDGFRILITVNDGIVPKLALVTTTVWAVVYAFKAWDTVSKALMSPTGIVGLLAVGVGLVSYFIGLSNSSKKATDSLTQLNNSMNIVNTSMTNLSKASERVRQIEYLSEVHEKLNTKLKNVDKSSRDYVDTLNLYKKVQNQINNLGNQYGVKLDNGKSRYEAERDQVSQLITKLKELETQKQRMYEKDLQRQIKQNQNLIKTIDQKTYGNSGSDFFDLKKYYYQAWQQMDREQIKRGREMTERWIRFNPNFDDDQIAQNISDFRKDPTGWYKSMSAAYSQAQKNLVDLGIEKTKNDLSGLEIEDWTEDPSDKIKTVLSTLTESEVNMIKTISNALNDLLPAGKKFDIDTQRIFTGGNFTNPIDVNMPSEISNQLMSEFNSINQITEQFAERQVEIEKEKQKALDMGKMPEEVEKKAKEDLNKASEDYGKKLQQDYDDLVKMTKGLDMTNPALKGFADYMEYLKARIDAAKIVSGGEDKKSKFSAEQITTAFNSLTSALQESGNAALEFASIITNSLSGAFKNGNFDSSAFSSGMQGGFITMWFNAVVDALRDKPEPVRYQAEQYDVSKALQERQQQDARLTQLEEMRKYRDSIVDAFPNWKIVYNDITKQMRELEDKIKQSIDEWAKAIGTSINDIATKLENAFEATNAFDFLQNWNQNLYEMTRQALIRGFMAQEAYQALYKGLSDTIALAVLDGQLSAQELLDIRTQGNALGSQLSVLYQALNILESTFPGANQGSSSNETSYTAGSNQAITYNIYATIEAGIFWGDRDKALEAAIEIGNLIAEETGRA